MIRYIGLISLLYLGWCGDMAYKGKFSSPEQVWDRFTMKLMVLVVEAQGLYAKKKNTSDTYAKITLSKKEYKTKVCIQP